MIIHAPQPVPAPHPAKVAAALARLCKREGLDASEIAGVLAVVLIWHRACHEALRRC